MLAEARRTRCFFDVQGSCRDGPNCRFMHSSDPSSDEKRGRISKWRPKAPNGALEFVDIREEELFAPWRSFAGVNFGSVREGMEVRVLRTEKSQRSGTRAKRIARRGEPVFSGWN